MTNSQIKFASGLLLIAVGSIALVVILVTTFAEVERPEPFVAATLQPSATPQGFVPSPTPWPTQVAPTLDAPPAPPDANVYCAVADPALRTLSTGQLVRGYEYNGSFWVNGVDPGAHMTWNSISKSYECGGFTAVCDIELSQLEQVVNVSDGEIPNVVLESKNGSCDSFEGMLQSILSPSPEPTLTPNNTPTAMPTATIDVTGAISLAQTATAQALEATVEATES